MISVFYSFKAEKAKKAALIAITANLQSWMSNHPNMLLQHSEATFIPPKRPIWMEKLQTIVSKANIGLEGQKIEGKGHNLQQQDESIYKNQIILIYKISSVSPVFWSTRPILALELIVCNFSI